MTIRGKRMLMLTDGNIDNASARIRAIQYIPFFQDFGFKVSHIPRIPHKPLTAKDKYFTFPLLKRFYHFKMAFEILFCSWDIVYIQRFFVKEYLLKILRKRAVPIIYDFDDAIYINERNPESKRATINMIRYASKVIISTDYLQDFCVQNGKAAEIINTPVETDRIYLIEKPTDHLLTIGWIGSPWTSGFLEIIKKPLQRLAQKYTFCFLTVGAERNYTIENVNHHSRDWSFEKENEDLSHMDIGIMPLPDTDYAGMKGGYKLILYMSAAIPCVASPVGINQLIVKPGENGFLAKNEEEWYERLELLIKDSALRKKLGNTGREHAVQLYSRDECFKKLLNIIKTI